MKHTLYISFLLFSFASGAQGLWTIPKPVIPAVVINYATWNPADAGAGITFSNANLTIAFPSLSYKLVRSTIGKSSGKWYWEVTVGSPFTSSVCVIGIANSSALLTQYCGENTNSWGIYDEAATSLGGGYLYNNAIAGSGYSNYTVGSVLGFALDMDAGTLSVTLNGSSMGSMITGLSGIIYAAASIASPGSESYTANFGAISFAYSVPSGYNPGLY